MSNGQRQPGMSDLEHKVSREEEKLPRGDGKAGPFGAQCIRNGALLGALLLYRLGATTPARSAGGLSRE